jgi:hypothetical protein
MTKKKFKPKLKSIPLKYTINVYGLDIDLRKIFLNTVMQKTCLLERH